MCGRTCHQSIQKVISTKESFALDVSVEITFLSAMFLKESSQAALSNNKKKNSKSSRLALGRTREAPKVFLIFFPER